MEDNHVDNVGDGNRKLDSIFTLFSDLTGDKNENPKYCLKLLRSLREDEFRVGLGSNLDYSLRRLVRGLGSTRLYSQCGCFAVLTSILKYRACSVENVLQTLEKEQKPAKGATKTEIKAYHAECVLTCGAIIHSGQFSAQPAEVQEKILKLLVEEGKKKSYLLPVACQFLHDIISVIDQKPFTNVVWPVCKSELLQNLSECGPEVFHVLLACLNKYNAVVSKFLKKNSISPDLLIEIVAKSLFDGSVKCSHPVFDQLGEYICTNITSPVKFWSKCVSENAKANAYKDTVLITLFCCIIKNLKEATVIPKLLVPKFLETLIKVLSLKKSKSPKDDCTNTARTALNSMVTLLCAEGTSDETRFQAIKKLLFYPGNLKFEIKTGTKCMHTLVSHLSGEFAKKLVDIYRQVVSGEIKKKVDEDGTEDVWNSKEKQQALHTFTKTLNLPSLKKEIQWKLEEIKYIFQFGFLNKFQLSSEVQKCAKDCFYKVIMVQMPSLKDLIMVLDELLLYINENVKNKQLKVDEGVEDVWDKMFSAVEALKKKSKGHTFTAVHILLIYMGLYLLTDFDLAKNGVEELLSCYQHLKEAQKKKNSQDADTPHWTEVTVDLILSLLSRENRLWRHVVSCIFPQVVSQITPTALHQIIDALDPKSQNDVLRHPDSDDSDGPSDNDDDSDSTLSDTEDSDPEDEGNPNDQLRLAVRNALGYSAAQTDDESIDMDQMDEEEERRLNDSLSEAFRQFKSKSNAKKKKQTKEEEALTHFRLRVLDLIEIYVGNSPSMGGCLDLLSPLLDLLELSIKDHHQRPLQTRVDSVIKLVAGLKSHADCSTVDQGIVKEVFQSVISRKDTSTLVFVEMSPRIADCATYLVRCSQLLPSGGEEIPLVEEYQALLRAFFQSRDFRLPISMFQAVLRMSWRGNFSMVATLFESLASPTLRIFKKMKIIELLRIFYKNDKLHGSSDKSCKTFLGGVESSFVKEFTSVLSEQENKQTKSSEKMQLSFLSNVISLINLIQVSGKKHRSETKKMPPWKMLIEKMAEMELINSNKKTKSQLRNLAGLLKIQLPAKEETKKKRTTSEASEGRNEEESQSEEPAEKKEKKKKKRMSAEKRKLKKESRELREEMSASGLEMVRFSQVDLGSLPEAEVEDKEETEEAEPPKKKKKKERAMNGVSD